MNKFLAPKINHKHLLQHETKSRMLLKFLGVLLLFIFYFIFISYHYGVKQGIMISILTWSFFVLCTPIADAGILIDFPFRLITRMKMIVSEIIVWTIAISLNIYVYHFHPELYNKSALLILFKTILTQIVPYWIIIILSFIGTMVSIMFGDELLDKVNHSERNLYHAHKKKYRYLIMIFLFIVILFIYKFLLNKLGINIDL